MTASHVSPLAHQMDFPLVPVVHGEGQHVGRSNFSSIPGGRGSSTHLTGTTVSAGVPEEMPHNSQKKSILTLLLNVCQVLGLPTYCPQAAFIRGSMSPLGERTPSPFTGRGERDSGVVTWIPSIGWWYCWILPLVDIGSCLPLTIKGQDHSCYSQAISSGTAR